MTQGGSIADDTTLPDIETLTGSSGGAVSPDAAFNISLLAGTGMTTVGTPGSNQIVFNATGGGVSWTRDGTGTIAMAVNNGYIPTNAVANVLTLPAVAAIGTIVKVCGEGPGLWVVAQNAGQNIQFGNLTSTTGGGGSLVSTNRYDTVKLLCKNTNSEWAVLNATGTLNVV